MAIFHVVPGNEPGATPVALSLDVPADWQASSENGATSFTIRGAAGVEIKLAVVHLAGEPAARMDAAIAQQFGRDGGERFDLGDGRVSMQRANGPFVHAAVFVPCPGGVAVAIGKIRNAAAHRVPDVRAVLESVRVVTP